MSTANELLVAACTSGISCLDEMNLLRVIAQGAMAGGGGSGGPFVKIAGDTMTGALLLPSGSAVAPSLSHAADSDTGLWYPAADTIALSTSGVERLRMDAMGNVGIVTVTAGPTLTVNGGSGAAPANAGNAQAGAVLRLTGGGDPSIDFGVYGVDGSTWIQAGNKAALGSHFNINFNPNGGSIGIGTLSPTARLHLPAGTATANTAPLKMTAGTLLATPEIGTWEFTDDGTTAHAYVTVRIATVVTRVQLA